jgi:hypothetical protein
VRGQGFLADSGFLANSDLFSPEAFILLRNFWLLHQTYFHLIYDPAPLLSSGDGISRNQRVY